MTTVMNTVRTAQQEDSICSQLITFKLCEHGWPDRCKVEGDQLPYRQVWGKLALHRGSPPMRQSNCCAKEPVSYFAAENPHWTPRHPEMSLANASISMVAWGYQGHWATCQITPNQCESLYSITTDNHWYTGTTYLLVVDYFSDYIEIQTGALFH